MNESPKSVKDLILQNEALAEDNDTLYKTNEEDSFYWLHLGFSYRMPK